MQFTWISSPLTYFYKGSFSSFYDFSYSFVASNGFAFTGQLSFTFTGQESTSYNQILNYRSDYTQLIANYFQNWNAIRTCETSTGQYLINPIADCIEDINKYLQKSRKELWLETIPTDQLSKVNHIQIPNEVEVNNINTNNLLNNVLFYEHPISRYRTPEYWTDIGSSSGSVFLSNDSLFGFNSVVINCNTGETGNLSQSHNHLFFSKGQKVTASVYYRNDINSSYTGESCATLGMFYSDNENITNSIETGLLPGTSYQWKRASICLDCNKDYGNINFFIKLNNQTDISQRYYFCAPMLEVNNSASRFTVNSFDVGLINKYHSEFINGPFIVNAIASYSTSTGGISGFNSTGYIRSGLSLRYISDKNLFLSHDLIPTSIEEYTGNYSGLSVTNKIYGIIPSSYDSSREKGWLNTDTELKTYLWPDIIDINKTFKLAEPEIYKNNIENNDIDLNNLSYYPKYNITNDDLIHSGNGYSLEIEAFTIKNDKIWCVTTESYTGEYFRTLKIINPKYSFTGNHLEVIRDFRLNRLGTGGTISSVGFDNSTGNRLVIFTTGTANSGNYVDLKYDYFTFDPFKRTIFTRESYPDKTILIY